MKGKPTGDDLVIEGYKVEKEDTLEEMELYLGEFRDLLARIKLSGMTVTPLLNTKNHLRAIHLKKTSVNIPNKEFVMGMAFGDPN